MKNRVVISGIGVVSPYGVGIDTFWQNISTGRTAAKLITGFDVTDYPVRFAAEITPDQFNPREYIENKKSIKTMSKATQFSVVATQAALQDARLDKENLNKERFGVTLGVGGVGAVDTQIFSEMILAAYSPEIQENMVDRENIGQIARLAMKQINPIMPLQILPNMSAAHIAILQQAQGSSYSIATACTSSSQAIGEAMRQIQRGENDVVITGGTDSMINPIGLMGFNMLGVLSRNNENYLKASRPFDSLRDGFMLGEGAAILTLEELQHCLKRKGQIYCEVIGYASSSDAFRLTDEPPDGYGSSRAMSLVLEDANLSPEHVDYINAHGTSTVMNDKTETIAIKKVFGDYAYKIPISSTKSMIGHWAAACGAVELITSVLALKHQLIPPTINYEKPDPECDLDYVPNRARPKKITHLLSNSFGFGGQNACLVIKKF
jgi:3-oxoacyl-[acyl-carrier-protein] synthase II